MGFRVNDLNELKIIVGVTDNATKEFKRIKESLTKDTKEVGEETQKLGKTSEKNYKGMVDGIKSQIKPINSLILTTARLGVIFGVTFGTIIKAIKDTGKEIETLDKLSIKLGISASDLSMKFHGFDVTTQQSRIGVASLENTFYEFGNALLFAKLGVTETIAEADILNRQFGVTSRLISAMTGVRININQKMTREAAIGQIQGENLKARQASPEGQAIQMAEVQMTRQLSMTKVEYKRQEFQQTLALMRQYGVDTTNLQKAFTERETEDRNMALMQMAADRATAEGDVTTALKWEQQIQLDNFKRMTNDKTLINTLTANQEILLSKKVAQVHLQQFQIMAGGLTGLSAAMSGFAAENKKQAKAAAAIALASTIVNTASAIMYAMQQVPPASFIAAGLAAATGAVQIATISGQQFEKGGRPPVGQASLVGEKGVELFIPDAPGTIIPNNQLNGKTTHTYITVEINNPVVRDEGDIDKLTEEVSKRLASEAERI